MKRKLSLFLTAVVMLFVLGGCKKTIDDYPLSNLRAISHFSVETYHNTAANIFTIHDGVIDEANKTIVVDLPYDADLAHLRPTIELSPWSKVSPASLQEVDFSQGDSLDYVVTAQSGKQAVYTVYITRNFVYKEAEIYGVYLTDVLDAKGEARYARFTTTESAIWIPETEDMSALITHVDLSYASHRATIELDETGTGTDYRLFTNDTAIDYTSQIIKFRVTAENGTSKEFILNVSLIVQEDEE